VRWGRGIAPSLGIAVGSTVWMVAQWGWYVKWKRRGDVGREGFGVGRWMVRCEGKGDRGGDEKDSGE